MPFNLLLFPLVGGYYLIIRCERFRYIQQRLDSQKLLFNAVIAGVALMVTSFLLSFVLEQILPSQAAGIKTLFPIHIPYFGTAVLAFLLGISVTEIWNLFINETDAISKAIDRIGNELELLMKDSFHQGYLILFTLKNDKFYIGWAETLPIPERSKYIRIIPAFSGYRNDDRRLVFTTQYLDVYAMYMQEGKVKAIDELDINIVIKIEEIVTASRFDYEVFERFNSLKPKEKPEKQ